LIVPDRDEKSDSMPKNERDAQTKCIWCRCRDLFEEPVGVADKVTHEIRDRRAAHKGGETEEKPARETR